MEQENKMPVKITGISGDQYRAIRVQLGDSEPMTLEELIGNYLGMMAMLDELDSKMGGQASDQN